MSAGLSSINAQEQFERDTFKLDEGTLEICFIGHGTLMFKWNDMVIHIDPVTSEADYSMMPDADLVLVTHEHGDHLDLSAIGAITMSGTRIFCNAASAGSIKNAEIMDNGDRLGYRGIIVDAVPAYNIVNERSPGNPFHPKGRGNGYILAFGKTRVYVAGDTENIPEMEEFGEIDIAFLPMNLPYTMTPEMVAKAVEMLDPRILYPYHFGSTDTSILADLLKNTGIDLRIRKMN